MPHVNKINDIVSQDPIKHSKLHSWWHFACLNLKHFSFGRGKNVTCIRFFVTFCFGCGGHEVAHNCNKEILGLGARKMIAK